MNLSILKKNNKFEIFPQKIEMPGSDIFPVGLTFGQIINFGISSHLNHLTYATFLNLIN